MRRVVSFDRAGRMHVLYRSMGDDGDCSGDQVYDAQMGTCVDPSSVSSQSQQASTVNQINAASQADASYSNSGSNSNSSSIASGIASGFAKLFGGSPTVPAQSGMSTGTILAIGGAALLVVIVAMRRE